MPRETGQCSRLRLDSKVLGMRASTSIIDPLRPAILKRGLKIGIESTFQGGRRSENSLGK